MNRLIEALIICLVAFTAYWVAGLLPLPHPFGLIAQVIIGVVALIALLRLIWPGIGNWRAP